MTVFADTDICLHTGAANPNDIILHIVPCTHEDAVASVATGYGVPFGQPVTPYDRRRKPRKHHEVHIPIEAIRDEVLAELKAADVDIRKASKPIKALSQVLRQENAAKLAELKMLKASLEAELKIVEARVAFQQNEEEEMLLLMMVS